MDFTQVFIDSVEPKLVVAIVTCAIGISAGALAISSFHKYWIELQSHKQTGAEKPNLPEKGVKGLLLFCASGAFGAIVWFTALFDPWINLGDLKRQQLAAVEVTLKALRRSGISYLNFLPAVNDNCVLTVSRSSDGKEIGTMDVRFHDLRDKGHNSSKETFYSFSYSDPKPDNLSEAVLESPQSCGTHVPMCGDPRPIVEALWGDLTIACRTANPPNVNMDFESIAKLCSVGDDTITLDSEPTCNALNK